MQPQLVKDVQVIAMELDGADAETVANLADRAAKQFGSLAIVLGSVSDGKVAFAAKVTPDLVSRGIHAGNLVREVAKVTGGGGGGRPDFAQAGGKDPGRLKEALEAVPGIIESQLK